MITHGQYFRGKEHNDEHDEAANVLLTSVNALIEEAENAEAFTSHIDPDTGTQISGSRGGSGDGGFRLHNAATGAPNSSHKEAKAVDVYDPDNALDDYLDRFEDGKGGNSKLEQYDLYREHPDATTGWCHLSTRPPRSGKRTFRP
jgi:hypothetical protein